MGTVGKVGRWDDNMTRLNPQNKGKHTMHKQATDKHDDVGGVVERETVLEADGRRGLVMKVPIGLLESLVLQTR